MHELAAIKELLEVLNKVIKENSLKYVSSVTVKIGVLRQLIPEFFRFAFSIIAKDTIFESAKLIVKYIPVIMRCNLCKREFTVTSDIYCCPDCDEYNLTIISGKELILESVEGEQ